MQLKISLSAVLYHRLQEQARTAGVPTASYVRYLILKHLEQVATGQPTDQANTSNVAIPESLIEQQLKKDPHYYLAEKQQLVYCTTTEELA